MSPTTFGSTSACLQVANERLLALREQIQATKGKEPTDKATTNPPWQIAEPSPNSFSTTDFVSQLPSHLGWGSASASQAIRATQNKHKPEPVEANQLRADHPNGSRPLMNVRMDGQPLGVYDKVRPVFTII